MICEVKIITSHDYEILKWMEKIKDNVKLRMRQIGMSRVFKMPICYSKAKTL